MGGEDTLSLLHGYRHSLWHMRNSALHGGHDKISRQVFLQHLISEVQSLYEWDRSLLSLADKNMFKLPLCHRMKQGNQHLLLWVKRANLLFDSVSENAITTVVQLRITSWLSTWTGDHTATQDSCSDIISWSNTEAERDKCHTDMPSTGDTNLDATSRSTEEFDNMCCTE
jgi:hypothetical protein